MKRRQRLSSAFDALRCDNRRDVVALRLAQPGPSRDKVAGVRFRLIAVKDPQAEESLAVLSGFMGSARPCHEDDRPTVKARELDSLLQAHPTPADDETPSQEVRSCRYRCPTQRPPKPCRKRIDHRPSWRSNSSGRASQADPARAAGSIPSWSRRPGRDAMKLAALSRLAVTWPGNRFKTSFAPILS